MEVYEIERAAQLFYELCRQHPELCPHDLQFMSKKVDSGRELVIIRHRCKICHRVEEKIEVLNKE